MSRICPKCNITYGEDVNFCYGCGTLLQRANATGVVEGGIQAHEGREVESSGGGQLTGGVYVPTLESFSRVIDSLKDQTQTLEALSSKVEEGARVMDSLARRVLHLEEELKAISEEVRRLGERLERSRA